MFKSGFGALKHGLSGLLVVTAVLLAVSKPAVASDEGQAEYWLERLGPALNMTSYRGVFVYARGDRVHSMRIAHRYNEGMIEERLVLQDGGSGEIVRKGMNVVCVLPEQGRVKLDQIIPSGPFAEAFSNQLMPLGRWYHSELVGEDRVAGYETVIIALAARDAYRYSHRLWLEKSTGLLVKSNVGEPGGKVLEHFQFTSLDITDDISDSEFEIRTEGREVARKLDDPAGNPGLGMPPMEGWELGWHPEGFVPAAAPRSGKGKAVAFSDGVAAFSVFVEPERKVRMPVGASRIGATTVYMRELEAGGARFMVTVVGEVPPKTARQVAESVQVDDALALNSADQ
ncbi:MucB/RseB C-terminal domain-containing protein [Marinobacter sediminum]|uniref:MucB/RseB C-terminal domain-containing protein n=1 Tax=Marinobacter sediminum TaxID=256323 RepID=UPI00202F85B8|nr:MucB/RseB C-terminal domain-containing protein [Marinobacter sediminum]MCM0611184.1 MucB/RseB C-terminal domain-containing protein [Marinobacter sediminum]